VADRQFNKDSVRNILLVAFSISLICSVLVSLSAVILKPRQDANALLDQRRNILVAAGVLSEGKTENAEGQGIQEIFLAEFEERVVDLRTGDFVDSSELDRNYDPIKAAKKPDQSIRLSADSDIALLLRRENLTSIDLRRNPDGSIRQVILPVRGYGLWGTLYGYLALQDDYLTVAGLSFYSHKETPGLGGEVDNPNWKAQWPNRRIYDSTGEPAIRLVKGMRRDDYSIDALAGATLTTRGVENLIRFWTGELGFGPFLKKMANRQGAVSL